VGGQDCRFSRRVVLAGRVDEANCVCESSVDCRALLPAQLREPRLRVAELAAAGVTNRDIARTVFMSEKTVEARVGRIYRKLGIPSRTELGAWMASNSPSGKLET
jgi:DNA-binding NarL/FixJ family response regulator